MRLFTALCFDDETKNALFSAAKEAEKSAEGKFSLMENYHLTLVFIGETERREDMEKALSAIDFPSFDYRLSGLGTFDKGIFWAGTERNENLQNLYKIIKQKLDEIGIETEEREFIPHVTLARKFLPEKNFDFSKIEELLPGKTVKADRISLMKSERDEGVLRYTEIYSKKLL